jgi:RNA polymerase sigma-70 factor (ECF subfamily)
MIAPLAGRLDGYFHYHGARGAFLLQVGRRDEARQAFYRAIALAHTAAEAASIRQYLDRLAAESDTAASRAGAGFSRS